MKLATLRDLLTENEHSELYSSTNNRIIDYEIRSLSVRDLFNISFLILRNRKIKKDTILAAEAITELVERAIEKKISVF